jgi:hypothetical protein
MESQRSLTHSQMPATCPYPEPAQSSSFPEKIKTFQKTNNIIAGLWIISIAVFKATTIS